jgi:hypothetical protein
MALAPETWQFDLLTTEKLFSFAGNRGIEGLRAETLKHLWRVGLVRAEIVRSDRALNRPGLELLSAEPEEFTYFDSGAVPLRKEGYGGCFQNLDQETADVELLFHPFRLYVLYHVDRIFQNRTSSTQYFYRPDGFQIVGQRQVEHLNHWTSTEEFALRFEDWNRISELAIVMEPVAYEHIFQRLRWKSPDTEALMRIRLVEERRALEPLLKSVTALQLNQVRKALCTDSESLDENKLLHVLLRLMSSHERQKLRSGLGLAMLFYAMAETLRRALETAHRVELPEEDELGFGHWMDGARKTIYGTERINDASREVRRDFLSSMGLDCGIKTRCYVEGPTELGALASAVGDSAGTHFVNLAGQVLERHSQTLRFIDALKMDRQTHVFSVVVIDKDRKDNVRALTKAAREKQFFAPFFLMEPDFEFANFTLDELIEVAAVMAVRQMHVLDKATARAATSQCKSGTTFLAKLRDANLVTIDKSEAWGKALMDYALSIPTLPLGHKRAGSRRPILDVAWLLVRARDAGYVRSIEKMVVDPNSGELCAKG